MMNEWLRGKSVVVVCDLENIDKYFIYDLLCKYNCKIICICSSKEKINICKDKFNEFNDQLCFKCFNVCNELEWQDFVENLNHSDIRVDILINRTNIGVECDFNNLQYADFDKAMNCNFKRIILAIKYLMPMIKCSRSPSVITMLNLEGLSHSKGYSHYNSATVAVESLVRTVADENDDILFSIIYLYLQEDCKSCERITSYILKSINKRRKNIYVGYRAKLFRYLNKISPRLSQKLNKREE